MDGRTHALTHGHKGDFVLCLMLCIALDRQLVNLFTIFNAALAQ